MEDSNNKQQLISDYDLANYVVCPEAWYLKLGTKVKIVDNKKRKISKNIRNEWLEEQDLSRSLRDYATVAFLLLLGLFLVLFAWEYQNDFTPTVNNVNPVTSDLDNNEIAIAKKMGFIPFKVVVLLLLLTALIVVWDFIDRARKKLSKRSGLDEKVSRVSIKGSDEFPNKNLKSEKYSLTSHPDAIVEEDGELIPVDRQPATNKVKDRHVIKLMTHLVIMEENNRKKPPYGILIMGQDARSVKIAFTEEKKQWIMGMLAEMNKILSKQSSAIAAPELFKCKNCDVKKVCDYRFENKENKSRNKNNHVG